jgi:hypothetical protein
VGVAADGVLAASATVGCFVSRVARPRRVSRPVGRVGVCTAASATGRGVDLTEMDGEGTIRGRQGRQALEEGQQALRHALRQHGGDDLFRAGLVAGHRQHEGARPPRAAILLADQGIEQLQCRVALTDDAERQGVTLNDLVIRAGLQRQPIVALRPFRLADQVVGEAAIAGITAHVIACRLGLRKIAQCLAGPLGSDEDRALARLDAGIVRRHLFGACIERRRAAEVAKRQRQVGRRDQRIQIAGIGGERPHLFGEPIRVGGAGQRLHDLLRRRCGRDGCQQQGRGRQQSGDDDTHEIPSR